MPAIEVSNLGLHRSERWLFREMSWALPKGKFLAVTGVSGVGKSSLLKILSGETEPDSGEYSLAASDIGIVFQNLRLTPNLSVLKNVLCGRLGAYSWLQTLLSFPESERRAAFSILSELELDGVVHRKVRKTSGGEQQRTAVARVILQDPPIILADEPTSSLDVDLASKVLNGLRSGLSERGASIVCVLHDSKMVERFADYELQIGPEHENGWRFRKLAGRYET